MWRVFASNCQEVHKNSQIPSHKFSNRTFACMKSSAVDVLLNFNFTPCSSVCLDTAERSGNMCTALHTDRRNQSTHSVLVVRSEKRYPSLLCEPVCLNLDILDIAGGSN